MFVHVDTSEVHALADDMRLHAEMVPARVEAAVFLAGHDMHATAVALSPNRTGLMDSSDALTIHGLGFDLGPTVDYGGYVELGTSRQAPEPFLGPAFDQHLPDLERALGDIGADVFRG